MGARPTALFTHPACLGHDTGPYHPECADRLRVVLQALEHPDFVPLLREQAPLASPETLMLAHPAAYVDGMLSLPPDRVTAIDADTLAGPGSLDAARRAVGGAVAAVDAVMEGWAGAAFVAVRPPGHHAEPAQAMGFCLFATVAIAALHARVRWGLERVAVLDFDVHHGNGTQAVALGHPFLTFIGSHQHPCYPGTGGPDEAVPPNIVNLCLPPGTDGLGFRRAWERVGLPALVAARPQLVLVSAGFDAHRADPLAELRLETEDFGWITDRILEAADLSGAPVVSVLEGGYDLPALAASAALHVRHLMRL